MAGFLTIAAIFLALALFATLLAVCMPAARFSAANCLRRVLSSRPRWYSLRSPSSAPDKPGAWFLLLTGQIFVGAGVAALIMSQCCLWVIAAGLLPSGSV